MTGEGVNELMDWDERYQEDNCPWDHGEPAPGLVEWLESNNMSGTVLVPGCGLGYDARVIAEHCPSTKVIGLDISPTAVKKANAMINPDNVTFREGDLFDTNNGLANSVDWIFEHTCFCAIPIERRKEYVASVTRILKGTGSELLGVFFINPDMDEGEEGPPFGVSTEELEASFSENFEIHSLWKPSKFYHTRVGRELMMHLTLR